MTRKHRLNVQGLSRSDKRLMENLIPPPGHVFVSIDLSSGEPTVTGQYSKDPNYLYATYDGVGLPPKYENGILMVDDIYMMTASVSPLAREAVRTSFDHEKFNGLSFAEQWVKDSEVIKKKFKSTRVMHKILCLSDDVLVAVRGKGYLSVADIESGDRVWDGEVWVECAGTVYKGNAEVVEVLGTYITPDHKLQVNKEWVSASTVRDDRAMESRAAKELSRPSFRWADVWQMASRIGRSSDTWKLPIYICKLWAWSGMEKLRQFKSR